MDYGPLKMLGEPKIKHGNFTYTWDKFQQTIANAFNENINIDDVNKIITIQKGNTIIKLLNIRKIEEASY